MRRVVVALLLAATLLPGAAGAEQGRFTRHTFANGQHTRDYMVYVPAGVGAGAPVLVYLHGCSQHAADAAVGTRFNRHADEHGFLVVYPEQRTTPDQSQGNGLGCWNWFRPDHQLRGQGEPSTIAGITQRVVDAHGADPRRVYVHGASAGANMAVIMAATYPDLYAAAGALAGCPYLSCTDASGALAYAAMGPRARTVPVYVAQGTHDTTSPVAAGHLLVQQWLGTNDLADDGLPNASVTRVPAQTEAHDAAAGNGYAYTVERYLDALGCAVVEYTLVNGMGHAYPSGDPAGSYTDPRGPDVTAAAWAFFAAHALPDPGVPPVACADPAPPVDVPPVDVPAAAVTSVEGGGTLRSTTGERIHFSLDVAATPVPAGSARVREKGVTDLVVDRVLLVAALTDACGPVAAGPGSAQVIGSGTVDGAPALVRVCVQDNGEPGHRGATATPDLVHVECLQGCADDLRAWVPDPGIATGNVDVT
jgi:poly(hydroxyalkanoate) depolymerase family esterase